MMFHCLQVVAALQVTEEWGDEWGAKILALISEYDRQLDRDLDRQIHRVASTKDRRASKPGEKNGQEEEDWRPRGKKPRTAEPLGELSTNVRRSTTALPATSDTR